MIVTIVPSRGRPAAALELFNEHEATKMNTDTMMVFALDLDDPTLIDYLGTGVPHVAHERLRMGPTLNFWAARFAHERPIGTADVIGFMGDDHRPRTPAWDVRIADALAERPGVAYGDDLIHGANLPTAAWVSASIVRDLGYIAPPGLTHLYLDNFWLELGSFTNLTYLSQCVFEHLHPIAGKAEWDAGYIEVNAGDVQEHDRLEFERYLTEDWPAAREKIRSP